MIVKFAKQKHRFSHTLFTPHLLNYLGTFYLFQVEMLFYSYQYFLACLNRLCIKTGIQERGTECGVRREWGECYIPGNVAKHSGECPQTFRGMSPNVPGNVLKHSGEYPQTFRGMSPNIPGNVTKYSGECRKTFRGMS